MTKFAATYWINKYSDGSGGFDYELIELQTLFESIYEETETISEWTDTYDEVKGLLKDKSEGMYSVFVIGSINYSVDYWGEHDIDAYLEYSSVEELPEELPEEMLGDEEDTRTMLARDLNYLLDDRDE